MNLDQLIGRLQADRAFMDCVTEWRTLPATEGRYAPLPDDMDPRLCDVLRARGIHRLYCHQADRAGPASWGSFRWTFTA